MGRLIGIFCNSRWIGCCFALLLLSAPAYSQDGSDQQQSIEDILQNNGINPSQINSGSIKSYMQDNNSNNAGKDENQPANNTPATNNSNSNNNNTNNNTAQTAGHNLNQSRLDRASDPNATYGTYVFSQAAVTDVSELSTPPLDYPIGVGDHIVVALWGGSEFQQDYVVARDGSIFPAGLGKIIVQGLTFDAARALIYSRFKSIVPASTNIAITLGQPRTINVNVGGEVVNPGPLTVSAFSNAFNVIGLAGGITDYGNLRDIQVKRNGKVIEVLDVYKYLSTGEIGDNIYLQNNDFILVTFMEKKVQVMGLFKRPMYYQLKKDEGLKALLKYTGGLAPGALGSVLKITRIENEKQVIHNVNALAILQGAEPDYMLQDGDVVQADSIQSGFLDKIMLKGAVRYPGMYEFRKGDHLYDLIRRAGGVMRNAYLHRAYIFHGAADAATIKPDRLDLDISKINDPNNQSDTNNVLLRSNDLVQIFATNEFVDPQYVSIYGEVRKPDAQVPKYGKMTLEDLLYLSGGLKSSAQYGRIEISSVMDIDSARQGLKPTRTVIRTYAILPNLEIDTNASKVILKPYDQVFVRTNPTFRLQQNVQLLGLFQFPGYYPRLELNERLSDYVKRAGGFKENADLEGAILYRNKTDLQRAAIVSKTDTSQNPVIDSTLKDLQEPVSINLAEALKGNNKQDIILQDQDVIYVPEVNPFVSVRGMVQSPLRVTFDENHTKLSYYIDQAGGFGERPWRSKVYVTYASGKSRRTHNFAFLHFYPRIKEGAIINVPQRPQGPQVGSIITQSLTALIPILIGGLILNVVK